MTQASDPVVIASYARTPMGGFQGVLSTVKAPELGAIAVRAAVERAGAPVDQIDQLLMGCVLQAGLGQGPARQSGRGAGLPDKVGAITVNKLCGSGMQTAMSAADSLAAGTLDLVVAGGMESMSGAPFLLAKHRAGMRLGHDVVYDHMMYDGLEDVYQPGTAMGVYAEETARAYQMTRDAMDEYAISSLTRAKAAIDSGAFKKEIVPVEVAGRKGSVLVEEDEQPGKADISKIPTLKPAFVKDGAVTAANSSSISDGAAALVLTRESVAKKLGMNVVARIVAQAAHAHEPARFTTAPVPALKKVLERAGWSVHDVDLFEVNEAFAVVAMVAEQEIGIPREKLNVNGGACALGHPIGASGARIIATLLAALENRGLKKGVASLCIGGGEATAMALELV